jgi:AcrR family transcriptional regulator
MPSGHSPKRRRGSPGARRREILDAAAELLVRRGASATVDDVAAAAGVAKGTVYLYFPSKDALLAALRERFSADLLARVEEATRPSAAATHAARLERLVTVFVDFTLSEGALHGVLFREIPARDADEPVRHALAQLVQAGSRAGEFRVRDAKATSQFLWHGLHGLVVGALHDGNTRRAPLLRAALEAARATLGIS